MDAVRVALSTPAEFFVAPEFDPLAGKLERRAGVDRALQLLGDLKRDQRPKVLEIVIPAAAATPTTLNELRSAITAYCRSEGEIAAHDSRETRHIGFWSLRRALPILAIFLGLSSAATTFIHGALGSLLSNALVIAGWVVLWRPAELLLYDWWPASHRKALLDHLASMEVRVVGQGGGQLTP